MENFLAVGTPCVLKFVWNPKCCLSDAFSLVLEKPANPSIFQDFSNIQ